MIPKAHKAQLKQMGLPSDTDTIRRARMFMMESGTTSGEFAEMARVNPNSLRVFLSGSYDAHKPCDTNTLVMRASIKEAIDLHEAKNRGRRDNTHYTTAEFEELRASMIDALEDGSAIAIEGGVGIGKSWALQKVTDEINQRKLGRAIYVYCLRGITPQSFLISCCIQAKIPSRGTILQLLQKLSYFFEEEHPLLVLDEAQNLPDVTLETLRSLFDLRGYGIVLAASYDLLSHLREYKMQMWSSRIGRTHLLAGATKEEAARMLVGELGPMDKRDIDDTLADVTLEAIREGVKYKYIALRNLFWAIKAARKAVAAAEQREEAIA
ncbi:MAG: ATP-binding protein [Terracidiphilus sp.]|nr:ATP-binding protein [Terracidiphilus sp.]